MTKLNYYFLNLPINIEKMTVITIENTRAFTCIVEDCYRYMNLETEQLKLFDDDYKAINMSDLIVISDIMNYKLNSPTLLKHIFEDLEKQINLKIEVKTQIEYLLLNINNLLQDEILDHELALTTHMPNLVSLFKLFDIHCDIKETTIFSKIQEIITVYAYWNKKQLLVFINCLSYLTISEIKEIEKLISLNNVDVLFLEPRRIEEVDSIHIDDDLFLFEK